VTPGAGSSDVGGVGASPHAGYDGSVYFSHGNNIRILQPNGRHQFWAWVAGARGHRVIPDGRHLVASKDRRAIFFLDEFGRRKASIQPPREAPRWTSIMDLAFDQWTGFMCPTPESRRKTA